MTIIRLVVVLFGCAISVVGWSQEDIEVVDIDVGSTLAMATVEASEQLRDPFSPAWSDIVGNRLSLSLAPPVHPSIALRHDPTTASMPLIAKFARDERRQWILLRWPDYSKNIVNKHERFSDGAAIQFALEGGEQTSYFMGGGGMPVNIWYWKGGSGEGQSLVANGFGTTYPGEVQDVQAAGHYAVNEGGWWSVVFSRPLESSDEYSAQFTGHEPLWVAFAIWQGESQQRDGAKFVSGGWLKVEP